MLEWVTVSSHHSDIVPGTMIHTMLPLRAPKVSEPQWWWWWWFLALPRPPPNG
jgi:hypothetical protein